MGALFGFFGPPDPDLRRRIGDVLLHRGPRVLLEDESPAGTIGLRSLWDEPTRRRFAEGLARDAERDRTLALAGLLTNAASLARSVGVPGDRPLDALLRLYERLGTDFVQLLRGAFVIALRDGSTLHLFRDAVGARSLV